jgi:serine/threonine-protein kinase
VVRVLRQLNGTRAEEFRGQVVALMAEWFPERLSPVSATDTEVPERATATALKPRVRRSRIGLGGAAIAVALGAVAWGIAARVRGPALEGTPISERVPEKALGAGLPAKAPPTPLPAAAEPLATDAGEPPRITRAEPALAKSRAAHPALLRIRVKPWAEVFLDGRLLGQTPLPDQEVAPGPHSLILVNDPLGVRRSFQVRLRTAELKIFTANLEEKKRER